MTTKMLYVGIFVGLVLESWSLPVQNSSLVHQTRLRSKREYPEHYVKPEDMNAMDRILRVNQRMLSRGFPLREGDILSSGSRSVITCLGDSCRWPRSVDGFVYVPYIISPIYDDMDRITVETGMLDISSATCVKFVPRTHEANFLNIQSRTGCWSYLGMIGGSQTVSLQSPGCMWSGVAAHELMHALGFVHEQSRSDRDHHVSILWENIIENQRHNFKKYETNNLNTAYDYSSVMHYGRYAFSEDGGPTIIPKPDPYTPIGQRDGPSLTDIHKINILYNCGGRV
ncbi:high choriolytic enzyme 1-like [Sinocyclocheilus rhinocerous]|uniref:high choriolytic enzyme 1-like n=1 Tax=Sinocyclocheilus rhinocerous TaxID=307959 RepID=UPI0007B8FCA5|nr:PREDICTED: high choriolytic enzyme 1-like [Sinocyclocheilus rhinocerous]